jgi:hypothetical protein
VLRAARVLPADLGRAQLHLGAHRQQLPAVGVGVCSGCLLFSEAAATCLVCVPWIRLCSDQEVTGPSLKMYDRLCPRAFVGCGSSLVHRFDQKLGKHAEYLNNLYFTFVFLLR